LDGYPEIEKRLSRADGSARAREQCQQPVKDHLEEILETIHTICHLKRLTYKDLYLFQSRALGTCKPGYPARGSDIDIYIALDAQHNRLLMKYGVPYKDTGITLICGEAAIRYFEDLPAQLLATLGRLRVDLYFGSAVIPPAKTEYRDKPYYVQLKDLES